MFSNQTHSFQFWTVWISKYSIDAVILSAKHVEHINSAQSSTSPSALEMAGSCTINCTFYHTNILAAIPVKNNLKMTLYLKNDYRSWSYVQADSLMKKDAKLVEGNFAVICYSFGGLLITLSQPLNSRYPLIYAYHQWKQLAVFVDFVNH